MPIRYTPIAITCRGPRAGARLARRLAVARPHYGRFRTRLILNYDPSFGVRTNRFGFTISWATNNPVVVEACTNLANPIWFPVKTNTLTGGWCYFSDPQWTNYPICCYRLRSP